MPPEPKEKPKPTLGPKRPPLETFTITRHKPLKPKTH